MSDGDKVTVGISGQDDLEAEKVGGQWRLKAKGCRAFLEALQCLSRAERNPEKWPLPKGTSHVDLLLREFILRVRKEWNFPYLDTETCHCRNIPTEVVDRAILNGAHTTARVSRETSASTACGTCRSDVQSMIDYRLKGA